MKTPVFAALAMGAHLASAADNHHGGGGPGHGPGRGDLVSANALMDKILLDDLLAGSQQLEDFAYAYEARNRVFGEQAHKDTVDWLAEELEKTKFYDVEKQEQKQLWSSSDQSLSVADKEIASAKAMTYSPSGEVTGDLLLVNNLGCAAEDFPEDVKDKIALIKRGECDFALKVANAGNAAAVGAIIYNNVPGDLLGTLGSPESDVGPYVPVVGISQDEGQTVVDQVNAGTVSGDLWVETKMENRTTWNVLATTKHGNKDSVVMAGAHTDSVDAGPGINDDGSGTIALLVIARALADFRINNAVRFGFWTAEEFGLLGSTYYVNSLSPEDREKVRLYLNYDMIASPNYANLIYDGDGSSFNLTGPAGSAEIEALLQKYFDDQGIPHIPTAFDGRSDYQAFIDNAIPAGGIFSGAEEIKTEEQARMFGGTAGESYDQNYHGAGDNMTNLAHDAYYRNARGAAYSLATYAESTDSLPPKDKPEPPETRRRKRGLFPLSDHSKCTGCAPCPL